MEAYRYRFLDVGGGPGWSPASGHENELRRTMHNLRSAKLARENPKGRYIVFDRYIPRLEAKALSRELQNLYFIEGSIALDQYLPFPEASMDRVEMNFMWTPLASIQFPREEDFQESLIGIPGDNRYLHALREACRVLKPGGTLSITEKKGRLDLIRRILSHDSYLDLDGMWMDELGLDRDSETHKITKIFEITRTQYAQRAMEQQREATTQKEFDSLTVCCLELKKKK